MPIGIRVTDLPAALGALDANDVGLVLEDGVLRLATPAQIGATGASGVTVEYVTQAEYDAIVTPDPDTLYVITDAAGRTVLSGAGAPTAGDGIDGDFWIKTGAPVTIYGPKTGGAWGSGTSLVGPQGPPGDLDATIADAKGDLIVGTAANTVARLGVGDDDLVLTADSSTASGLKWAAGGSGGAIPFGRPSTGTGASAIGGVGAFYTLFPDVVTIANGDFTLPNGTMFGVPMVLDFDITISAMGLHLSTVAASSLVRFGFVPADVNWVPQTGVISVGTTFDTTTGAGGGKQITGLSISLTAGRWLRLYRAEGGAPVLRVRHIMSPIQGLWGMASYSIATPFRKTSSGTGAFADTISFYGGTGDGDAYGAAGNFGGGGQTPVMYDPMWVSYTAS